MIRTQDLAHRSPFSATHAPLFGNQPKLSRSACPPYPGRGTEREGGGGGEEGRSTLTATLPPEYALSSSGSSAGSSANSEASTPSQSSTCPSKVISPGQNSASTRPPPPEHVGASPWCSCAATAEKRAMTAARRATNCIM
jgi:hypothetical protein